MKLNQRWWACVLFAALAGAGAGCGDEDAELKDGVFTSAEWVAVQELSPLPEKPPLDPTNKYGDNPEAAKLGQMFFFEKSFSGPLLVGDDGSNGGLGMVGDTGKVACASCHEGPWQIDLRSKPGNVSLGTGWLPRNANSIVNAAYYFPWYENDGISDSMWSDALVDPELSIAMNGSRLQLVHAVYAKYREEYNAVFDPDLGADLEDMKRFPAEGKPGDAAWDGMTPEDQKTVNTAFANYGKAVEAYMRLFVSGGSAFDRYVAGETSAISLSAKRGLKLFVGKANCANCHKGNHFSDDDFHTIGLIAKGEHVNPDDAGREQWIDRMLSNPFNADGEFSDDRNTGRLKDVAAAKADSKGKWRTKGLRNVAMTAPYMHSGQFEALEDVVKFYNEGGDESGFLGVKDEEIKKLNLTDAEVADLVEFLKTLTGTTIPAALMQNTAKP
jgi:cytochrome c peroxidase